MKVVIDDVMYKFNADHQMYNNLFGNEDSLVLSVDLNGCTGNSTTATDLMLYSNTEIVPLDPEFGMIWGVDSASKPIIIMKSSTGNLQCDGGLPVVTIDTSDLIFTSGFE